MLFSRSSSGELSPGSGSICMEGRIPVTTAGTRRSRAGGGSAAAGSDSSCGPRTTLDSDESAALSRLGDAWPNVRAMIRGGIGNSPFGSGLEPGRSFLASASGARMASFVSAFCQYPRSEPRWSYADSGAWRDAFPPDVSSTPTNSTMGTVNPRYRAQKAVRNEAFIIYERVISSDRRTDQPEPKSPVDPEKSADVTRARPGRVASRPALRQESLPGGLPPSGSTRNRAESG